MLETERLILYRLSPADAGPVLELVNSPGWLTYIGDRGVKTLDDAKTYLLEGPIRSYRERGFGLYGLRLKEDDLFIGLCGLIKRDILADVDLGFALLPAYEGRGYAYEAAVAVLRQARTELDLERVAAIVLPSNERSIRLLKKLGFAEEGRVRFEGEDLLLLVGSTKG